MKIKNKITTKIKVKENLVRILRVGDADYISLTDLAKYQNEDMPSDVIKFWMSNKESFDFYSLWEELNNANFNSVELHLIKTKLAGRSRLIMTPNKWKKDFNAIGIVPSSGKYSVGTFAHPDIAFEFASWLSPEFKLYLITEFQRLKKNESYQNQIEWTVRRSLSKTNYKIHTDAIKEYIVPTLSDEQKQFIYANEADVINVALFGITAKEWRDDNPDLEGNIRDYADTLTLIILSNLEILNSDYIVQELDQSERLQRLNENAKKQMITLKNNINIDKIDKNIKLLDSE